MYNTTLIFGSGMDSFYENGVIKSENGIVAIIKGTIYNSEVESLIMLVNRIYGQSRPMQKDSYETMVKLIEVIEGMFTII